MKILDPPRVHESIEAFYAETDDHPRPEGVFDEEGEAERVLDGWAEACGIGGLAWLRDRLAVAAGVSA